MNLDTLKAVLSHSYMGAMVFFRENEKAEYTLDLMSDSVLKYFPNLTVGEEKFLKNILIQIVPDQDFGGIYNGILTAKHSFASEFEVPSSRDDFEWFEIRSSHIQLRNRRPQYLLLLLTSVTEEKKEEFGLKYKKDEIERASKMASLGEMAAGISHELNTPLNTIQNYVDLIKASRDVEDLEQYKKLVEQASEKIENTVDYIAEVISGLRLLSRFKKDEEQSIVNVRDLVESVVSILEIRMRHRGVKFHLDFHDDSLLRIRGFATQITQVVVNLVNNAVEAISEEADKWVRMELGQEGEECILRVIDSGRGVDPELEAKIMTPFFTTKDAGTGLGLSLSKTIVLNHGGRLHVNRNVPNTCFEVRLPTI